MPETVVAGIITGIVAIIVCMISNFFQSQDTKTQHDKTTALIQYKIEVLQKTVEKHNNLIERMAVVERDLKTSFNVLDEIKEDIEQLKK